MKPSEIAIKYIGQTEKPGNMGFNDAAFEKKMFAVGFQKTHAWCAYLQELIFKEAHPEAHEDLDQLFSASAVKTFENFQKAGYPISKTPSIDSLILWQTQKDGVPQWTGHAGIVVNVIDSDTFETVEGNTTTAGIREGYIVARRTRKVLHRVFDGLQILGFIRI